MSEKGTKGLSIGRTRYLFTSFVVVENLSLSRRIDIESGPDARRTDQKYEKDMVLVALV